VGEFHILAILIRAIVSRSIKITSIITSIKVDKMIQDVMFRLLTSDDLSNSFVFNFERKQIVHHVLRGGVANKKEEIDDFIDDWNVPERNSINNRLIDILNNNGLVVIAIYNKRVIGFASIGYERIGPNNEYCQLEEFHIENSYRKMGIGKRLFNECISYAKNYGIRKLYISSHSAIETIQFYKSVGCKDAVWIFEEQAKMEPCDYQMEYEL
jgi:GNAT superfamily N-acetyltransferase